MTLAEAVKAMSARSLEIDALDTQLAELIGAIESVLHERVRVRLEVEIDGGEVLGFGKIGQQWRLVLDRDGNETALASCPRDVRAEMFHAGHVARLLRDADADIVQQIEERQSALAEARAILAALRGES